MNYSEALAWLFRTQTFGIKLGLEKTHLLLAAVGQPHEQLRFLHVAGTNGKGSTCAMLDAILRAHGVRSGLYTSPHLMDFRERIRLDGELIPEEAVADGLTRLRRAAEGWEHAPTFFEIVTVLAAWWFAQEKADLVVWETGMGGRLDATNVVRPLASIITPIGLDHREWLGPDLASIAGEKAGIFKPGVPAVSAPQEAEARVVLEEKAAEVGAPLSFVAAPCMDSIALPGEHQRWNAALALAALDAAGLAGGEEDRRAGLAGVQWPARFQRVGAGLVVDGAHNEPAVRALVATWREMFGPVRARLVFGAMKDKDVATILALLRGLADEVWLVPVRSERSCALEELAALAAQAGFPVIHRSEVSPALAAASFPDAPVLVTGSLFLAAEVLAIVQGQAAPARSSQ
ncbi:MAG: bifunctional folylpolyglutamate synthase/dihydrofolate synthase [Chthoniobacterales bacterium]